MDSINKDKFNDIVKYIKSHYNIFDKGEASTFNWGYLTALNHYNIINDNDYSELISINNKTYLDKEMIKKCLSYLIGMVM